MQKRVTKRIFKTKKNWVIPTLFSISLIYWLSTCSWFFPKMLETPNALVNLAGEWEICAESPSNLSKCHWKLVAVPLSTLPNDIQSNFNGWLHFKKKFTAPQQCKIDTSCSLLLAEVGDAAEVFLNDKPLAKRGEFPPHAVYNKHYPVLVDFPKDLLLEGENKLQVQVYSMKGVQAGIRRFPVGIFETQEGFRLSHGLTTMSVAIPIVIAVCLFILSLLAMALLYLGRYESQLLERYVCFLIATGTFMMGFSEVPREFMPIWAAGFLHFFLRLLHDYTHFEFVIEYFEVRKAWVKVLRVVYALILGSYFAAFLWNIFTTSIENRGSGFDTAVMITRIALPVILLPHLIAVWNSFKGWKNNPKNIFVFLFFAAICFAQLYDNLIFHNFIKGQYAVKFYPLLQGMVFGWLVILQILKLRESEVVERNIGQLASQVAHDLRSPLMALRIGVQGLTSASNENKDLIEQSVKRVSEIADNLLKTHATESSQTFLSKLKEEMNKIIREKETRWESRLSIETRIPAQHSFAYHVTLSSREWGNILSNLIDNAVEATSNKQCQISIVWKETKTSLIVSVQDNGQGICEENLSKLASRGATFGKENGNGLALYQARTTLEKIGGHMEIQSSVGEGTTITLQMPITL